MSTHQFGFGKSRIIALLVFCLANVVYRFSTESVPLNVLGIAISALQIGGVIVFYELIHSLVTWVLPPLGNGPERDSSKV